ncbi:hypothetical protein GCM10022243_43320 [Saccharothrix violaceirubra]|uniref:Endonuclease/exonuclease/phosphatase family metal-dependent hydrolase/uncharacterized protein (UPF0248 family) n=1 Tax=Saccharothrix violaceirubra TaxID=413306 RepID=A0A7W7T2Y0_9PSEU|nr:RNA repair domain-containing protein [Saccharothrix violaceirubra]MBB4965620.1 endonuclease/exonuclease/phosphatase family metal-dependent hydrolase/uncharacterized protein (UPF0248 family) [Saccharothrix violaceirubra]
MRTSEQVYHQVRWDSRLDPARFVVGVAQRGREPKRVPFAAFMPGGDVPWHRVLFLEADGEVVWDRAAGIDRVAESGAGRVRRGRRLRAPFTPAEPHGHAAGGTGLRVLTWNTLWDRFDRELIHTARRRPLLLDLIAAADADVIALQEVERDLLAALTRHLPGYALDADPARVEDTGLVLLSRLPVLESARLDLGPHKAVHAIVVDAGDPVTVAVTHLTSDHTAGGAAIRTAQLAVIAEALAPVEGDVVLVGDFNHGGTLPVLGMRDAWTELHDDDAPTFDPVGNPLAAVSSLSGRSARLDRVFVRGTAAVLRADLVGTRPVDGLFASDHYGVVVDLGPRPAESDVLDVPPTPRTAVVWLPGPWPEVDAVRESTRWPPHVTLLFGFVPESDFDRAVPLVADAVEEIAPFPVRVEGVGTFGDVVWLDPAARPAPWAELHAALLRRFPACRARFTPHLTVGTTERAAARIPGRDFGVGEVVVLSRRGDGPMLPRAVVGLGTGEVRWIEEPPTPPGPDLDAVADRVVAALPGVHVVGSRAIGGHLPDADLDLVAPDPPLDRVRALGVEPVPVVGARTPGYRFAVSGLSVDLLASDDDIATGAITDAAAVRAAVGERHASFVRVVRVVKAWARARGVDSAPFGGLPGLAWSVLAARAVCAGTEFFATWAAWDWHDPVALHGQPARTGEAVTVLTPTAPIRSCTGQVTPGFRDLLTRELFRAWEIVESGDLGTLCAPPDGHRVHAAWAVVTTPVERVGLVRGRMRALLGALEPHVAEPHAWPRPIAHDPVRFAVGLGPTPPSPATLADLVAPWVAGLPDVEVAWTGNGSVPTLR